MGSRWWLIVVALNVGCTGAPPTASPFIPPAATAHGLVQNIVIPLGYTGSREIGSRMAQALRECPKDSCVTVQAVDGNGHVLACATVCRAPTDFPQRQVAEDARVFLAGCLSGLFNWETPTLLISADAAGSLVVASAAFATSDAAISAPPYRRPVCLVIREPPLHIAVTGANAAAADRVIAYGQAHYPRLLQSEAAPQVEISGR